jgi:hypothetical protein
VKVGDLVKFCYVNDHCRDVNNKMGIFLGDRHINRSNGVIIRNFAIHILGEDDERLCDEGLKRWLSPVR